MLPRQACTPSTPLKPCLLFSLFSLCLSNLHKRQGCFGMYAKSNYSLPLIIPQCLTNKFTLPLVCEFFAAVVWVHFARGSWTPWILLVVNAAFLSRVATGVARTLGRGTERRRGRSADVQRFILTDCLHPTHALPLPAGGLRYCGATIRCALKRTHHHLPTHVGLICHSLFSAGPHTALLQHTAGAYG